MTAATATTAAVAVAALVALAPPVDGWVLYSPYGAAYDGDGYFLEGAGARWTEPTSFDLSKPVFRWTRDGDAFGNNGLGGGITWGMHPDFCAQVIPTFREERFFFDTVQFMTCGTLRHAIAVSFQTWASNHHFLNFKDVTDECAAPGAIDDDGNCRFAEVTIATQQMDGPMDDTAAFVRFDTADVGRSPTTTAGDVVVGGLGARRAQIKFATSLCWYLDATFCSMFHELNKIDSNFVTYVRFATFVCFGAALVSLLKILSNIVASMFGHASAYDAVRKRWFQSAAERARAQQRERHSTNIHWRTLLEYLTKMPVFGMLFSLFWTIFMPVFYNSVFMPCAECYGFSGVLAHEAGHLLGFQHPDVYTSMNLRAHDGVRMNASTCHRSLDHVELRPLDEGTDTIMNSVAAHRPKTCLTVDDLEGLNFLYPTCGEDTVHVPVCTKPLRLTGYLRLLIAVFLPYSIVTVVVLWILAYVRWRQREHVTKLRENVNRRSRQGVWLRAGMRATWAGPIKASRNATRRPGRMRRSLTRAVLPGMGGDKLVKALFGRAASRRAAAPTQAAAPSKPSPSLSKAAKSVAAPRRSVTRRPLGGTPIARPPTQQRQRKHQATSGQWESPPRRKNEATSLGFGLGLALDTVAEVAERDERDERDDRDERDERAGVAGLANLSGVARGGSASPNARGGGPPVARAQETTALTPSSTQPSIGAPLASPTSLVHRRPPAGTKSAAISSASGVVTATLTSPARGRRPPSEGRSHPPKATRQRPPTPKLDDVATPGAADLRYVGTVAV